jgi:hypothetical protein
MSFLKVLAKLLAPAPTNTRRSYWVVVQCSRCGETLRTRVDLSNDLSIEYGENEDDFTYFCRKTVIGSHGCYQPIEVELTFDNHRHLLAQKIRGGKFIQAGE